MGRKARQLEIEQIARDEKIMNSIRSHESQKKIKPEPITWDNIIFDAITSNEKYWINDPSTWTNSKKTKNIDTLRLDMIRYVFSVYKCPIFLEHIWLPEYNPNSNRSYRPEAKEKPNANIEYVSWYLTVAQGGSLYKVNTKGIMTKKETHAFIHAPKKQTIKQNIWWARALCESNNNIGIASRVAQSNLVGHSLTNEFWISVMRFFVRFPTNVSEMNDLMDFFVYMRQENDNYTLKSRSLDAVRVSCEEWHRFLNKQKTIGGGSWTGSDIENWRYVTGKDEHKIIWRITQINTGNDLLKEGQKMRHCVSIYKRLCMDGTCSIWSMSTQDMAGNNKRCLTIELGRNNEVVQSRGLANREPKPNESSALDKWCMENNLRRRKSYW